PEGRLVSDSAVIQPPEAEGPTPTRVDGRRLRSERTRRLIVEAYMSLVRETNTIPTAVQIAERAGYSVRSIFERFPDLHALRVAVTDYAIAEGRAQGALRDLDGDRATRIRSQIDQRANGCEKWLPLWRALNANRGESAELEKRIMLIRELVVLRMELMFKPELSVLSADDKRRTLIALETLTDFESWARMREFHGLSFTEACTVWHRSIDRLLPATPAVAP